MRFETLCVSWITYIYPDHIQNSILYSQILRLSNICTYEEDFDKHALNMKSWFLESEYSKWMIDSQMGKFKFCQRLKAGSKQAGFGVLFVITYHPKLKKIAQIMKKLEHTSTITGESFKINDHLCCNDTSLIYLLTCKVSKEQYTGKTDDKYRLPWNNYKESDRKLLRTEEIKQKSLHEHFLSDSHQSFEDVSICLIDKTDPSDPHRKEYYWMRTLKTLAPFGLNTEETY